MVETLYKTPQPKEGISECYVLVLTTRPASGGRSYLFMEEHGHWDESLERFLYEVKSISAAGELNRAEALDLYNTAKRNLAQRGFIHSFVADHSRPIQYAKEPAQRELAVA